MLYLQRKKPHLIPMEKYTHHVLIDALAYLKSDDADKSEIMNAAKPKLSVCRKTQNYICIEPGV